ncbi:MAG TPA: hypothetical protein VI520_02195, partial [Anaerolineales bacterium]|nr:hypothetical protein [Anaerolineales bacterium]
MKTHKWPFAAALSAIILAVLACGGSFSTANIKSAWLSADSSGTPETTQFTQDQQTIYCIVELRSAPDDTIVKAVWTAVSAEGSDPNLLIDETEFTSGDATLTFDLTNDLLWPVGSYKV